MNKAEIGLQEKWYVALARHPLVVLILGTVLSCWLIPWISSRANNKRLQQEKRVNKAIDILGQSLIDEERLNLIQTAFETFQKHCTSDPDNCKRDQQELRQNYDKLYSEFDQHAWWWYRDLDVQARLLHLPPGSTDKILRLRESYKNSLLHSVHQIAELGPRFLARDYRLDDPNNTEAIKQARAALSSDVIVRSGISSELAGTFMLPEP
jgi:hypothetical protein